METPTMTGFTSKRQMAQDKVAQPAQEPVATKNNEGITLHVGWDDLPVGTKLYTTPPAAQPEQDAYTEGYRAGFDNGHALGFTEGSDMTLTQPVQDLYQEKCLICDEGKATLMFIRNCNTCGSEYSGKAEINIAKALKRPWIGLTDEEMDEWTPEIHGVIRSIEAALRSKNT